MFNITPNPIVIQPNCTQSFAVTFAPLVTLHYKVLLNGHIKNANNDCKSLTINVRGNSLMPKYHFDLERSDYLTTRRKCKRMCGEDVKLSDIRVVEFEAIGLKTPVIR